MFCFYSCICLSETSLNFITFSNFSEFLYLNVDTNPTRYNSMQSDLFYCKIILHVKGVHRTHQRCVLTHKFVNVLQLNLVFLAVAQWLRRCSINRKVAGSIPAGALEFFIDIKSFRSHCGPGVDSASNRNEYQELFPGGKVGRRVRLTTYHHPVPLSRNLGTVTS